MASNDSQKGNPASKRMQNPARKARRGVSWARAQRRKKQRQAESLAAQRANVAFIEGESEAILREAGHQHKRPSKQARAIRRALERQERDRAA